MHLAVPSLLSLLMADHHKKTIMYVSSARLETGKAGLTGSFQLVAATIRDFLTKLARGGMTPGESQR